MNLTFDALRNFLAHHGLLLLFLTIGLGYLLSHLEIAGVSLGVAAVLFVGLALGAWEDGRFMLPEIVGQLGLLLFIYPIGLQAGPSFFRLFRKRGLQMILLTLAAVSLAGGLTWLAITQLGIAPAIAVGLFCGGTTNTPALAMVSESLRGTPLAAQPAVGYSIAYPLAVLLPILLAQALVWIQHLNLPKEAQKAEQEAGAQPQASAANLRLDRKELAGHTLKSSLLSKPGIKVSRIQRGNEIILARPDTLLAEGDILHIVASAAELESLSHQIGPQVTLAGPETSRQTLDFRRVVLTNPELIGKTLQETHLERDWEVVVTRLRRGDVDFVPSDETILERGDRLRIVAPAEKMSALTQLLGDSLRSLGETDFVSLSLGILLGILLGEILIPIGSAELKLGMAGGSLVVALILGWLGRTGPIIWNLPLEVNMTFRQLGMMLFFASVGLRSGGAFVKALQSQGPLLLLTGALITLGATLIFLVGSYLILRWDWVTTTGTLAGGQTQPAILAFVNQRVSSEAANIAYVGMMPAAMISKILLAQLLLWFAGL
ncbi:transporter [bacterium (Candidatus Blackallbacteria) CG17_big_fil_post_rev_8_21_14_2_50_48_46]|uniref:Transporter n=1 Tax=bacterium (Candidatus Blackallbacteria) CG17_big_fil_post_rev_8_21_14_2_50_48_46 TaxID=2014261 RepID=A0A2M7GB12_9BACT|nr:MAG: transporter [bacterium (Candidatus Blackallbacteria) CG18_big_fil_WC_8_21_14_2_50_49_26]PIW19330.1 MAG: transporter [bacterium (Candidatus Blackallbacteria) CG17_big_fil_post_rev_8_21_14_2_50_48_46]PIW49066.1 MAG: transporter [bacterium (Candidatus Blackallbacteria) CG13_big_fil_rev_8_21_14_2_50_49_14]